MGPYQVTEVFENGNLTAKPLHGKKSLIVHSDRCKLCKMEEEVTEEEDQFEENEKGEDGNLEQAEEIRNESESDTKGKEVDRRQTNENKEEEKQENGEDNSATEEGTIWVGRKKRTRNRPEDNHPETRIEEITLAADDEELEGFNEDDVRRAEERQRLLNREQMINRPGPSSVWEGRLRNRQIITCSILSTYSSSFLLEYWEPHKLEIKLASKLR